MTLLVMIHVDNEHIVQGIFDLSGVAGGHG